mgnify:CR=1 FL=1
MKQVDDGCTLTFDLGQEALQKLVQIAWQSLSVKRMTGNLDIDVGSGDSAIILMVLAVGKALERKVQDEAI